MIIVLEISWSFQSQKILVEARTHWVLGRGLYSSKVQILFPGTSKEGTIFLPEIFSNKYDARTGHAGVKRYIDRNTGMSGTYCGSGEHALCLEHLHGCLIQPLYTLRMLCT